MRIRELGLDRISPSSTAVANSARSGASRRRTDRQQRAARMSAANEEREAEAADVACSAPEGELPAGLGCD